MRECSKAIPRRLHDSNFVRKYFVGRGIDIGGKPDPLELYKELFCGCTDIKTWDLEDGDAQDMQGVADSTFDFVFSSHCLEHIREPANALKNWIRITKPGGHLVITVPDEDMYEQNRFPSTHNKTHLWTFTIHKRQSWSSRSLNLSDILAGEAEAVRILKIEELNADYRYRLPRYDRTVSPVGEAAIELILRKRTPEEIAGKGYVSYPHQPDAFARRYYNQYRTDQETLKRGNNAAPPFADTSDID